MDSRSRGPRDVVRARRRQVALVEALFVVNQFTGDLFGEKTTVPFGAAHVLPFTTVEGADAVLIVASNGTARAFPSESTPDALRVSVDCDTRWIKPRTRCAGTPFDAPMTTASIPCTRGRCHFLRKPDLSSDSRRNRTRTNASIPGPRPAIAGALQIPQSQHRVSRHERWEARASDAHRRRDGKNLIPRSSR